jgi:hypothetical protein
VTLRLETILVAALIIATILLAGWNYLVRVYEYDVRVDRTRLPADGEATCLVEAVSVNALGGEAWFRSARCRFAIERGARLVEIVEMDEEAGTITLRAGREPGEAVVVVQPEGALFPTKIVIRIYRDAV